MPDLYYHRRLPHWIPENVDIFVTWRLSGSLPAARYASFAQWNDALDRGKTGPLWLSDGRVAGIVREALIYGEQVRKMYELHAWVVMPNHVHLVLAPKAELPKIMQWIKRGTGWRANQLLGRNGKAFWQDESYDHWIRSNKELDNTIAYVERNPVKAGLALEENQWPWSSAGAGR